MSYGSFLFCLFFIFLNCTHRSVALEESTVRIVGEVNQDVITQSDLKKRLQLVSLSSPTENTTMQEKLTARVLAALVDEKLQIQEASRFDLVASQEEIEEAIALLERANSMAPGEMREILGKNSIPFTVLQEQVKAQLSWLNLVRLRVGKKAAPPSQEVQKVMAALGVEPQAHFWEIVLSGEKAVEEARNLREEIEKGADFAMLASQLSEAASAARGGEREWIGRSQLPAPLAEALFKSEIAPGAVVGPIETPQGVYLVKVQEIRAKAPQEGETETVIGLKQVTLRPLLDRSPEAIMRLASTLDGKRSKLHSCEDVERVAQEIGGYVDEVPEVILEHLSGELHVNLVGLRPGDVTRVMSSPEGGAAVAVVCSVQERASEQRPMTEKEVEQRLTSERLEKEGQRYLKRLRDGALIRIHAT